MVTNTEEKPKIPAGFHGKKGRSGRKPKLIEELRQQKLLNDLDSASVKIIEHQLQAATNSIEEDPNKLIPPGLISLAQWCYEQNHGKAKQALDVKSEVEITLSPELLAERLKAMELEEKKLLAVVEGDFEGI